MLRSSLLIVLGLLVAMLGASAWLQHGQRPAPRDLPWAVEVLPGGGSRVFGVTLGQTTARAVSERLKAFPRIALFVSPNGRRSVEAYFGSVTLGMFEARLDAVLHASPKELAVFERHAVGRKPMPSGAYRLTLTEADTLAAFELPIAELSYAPGVPYADELVLRSFGEPAQRVSLGGGRRYWLYPARGLIMRRGADDAAVLHYVVPADFGRLRGLIAGQAE
jgi:hypothetical protein